MTSINSKIVSIDSLTPYVLKLVLDTQQKCEFKAGQYLQVVMGEKDKRPFSIANMPSQDGLIELHIGATIDNPYAYEVVEKAKNEQALSLEIGLGNAYLRESDAPIILIAGGTGYSYTKSILFDCLRSQPTRAISLYWGAKTASDLYEAELLQELAQRHEQFRFIPVIEQEAVNWSGKSGLVHEAVMSDYANFENIEVYVAGRFEMSRVVRDTFLPLGLDKDNLFGDAFAYI